MLAASHLSQLGWSVGTSRAISTPSTTRNVSNPVAIECRLSGMLAIVAVLEVRDHLVDAIEMNCANRRKKRVLALVQQCLISLLPKVVAYPA